VSPQRWHRNRPAGAADGTGALAPRRHRDWAKPTLESGTRGTYVTRRWLIGPSWSGTLGTSGWLSASALNSVPKSGHTSKPGKRALQACIRPITKSRLASSCCDCGARVDATNGPDCRLEVILCGSLFMSECKRPSSFGQTLRADNSPVALPRLRTRISSICGRSGRRDGVGGNRWEYSHDRRLILRVPNVKRICAMTCLVSDAQDCPLEGAREEVNVCGRRVSQPHASASQMKGHLT
jgi:hypothetical protein